MHVDASTIEHTIPERFAEQARRHGARIAIVTDTGRVTYAALDQRSDRIANALISQGLRRGQTVGILVEHGIDQIAAILGALKAGGIYVPLDASLGRGRLREVLSDADPLYILTDRLNHSLAHLLGGRRRCLIDVQGELPAGTSTGSPNGGSPDDYAYIYYTSGTTGLAKGVVDNHRNVLHNVARYTAALDVVCRDRLTLLQSCGFSGAVSNIFTALLNGATLLPFDVRAHGPTALATWLAEQEPTIYHSVPSLFRQVMACGRALPSLRIIRLEGDLARPVDVAIFNSHFDARCTLVNGLGATETGISAQYFIAHGTTLRGATVPVGTATADVRIDVVDPQNRPAVPGALGEIVISSRYLACGYWRRPDLTELAFFTGADGTRCYRTHDLGRFDAAGLLELHGRADSQAKVRGAWVDLSAVERSLAACVGVREAIVEMRPDPADNPRLVAWVLPDSGGELSPTSLRNALAAQGVATHALPGQFVLVNHWPLDRNGKVDRRALPLETTRATPPTPPRSHTEQLIAGVFKRRLGVPQVASTDDFFELGGDSLQAIEACLELEHLTGTRFALGTFQQASSVAALARALDDAIEPGCVVPLQPQGSGPPLFCVHAHMGHVFNLRELAAQFAPERPFFAIQARGLNARSTPETDLQAMADDYVDQILASQPGGPYLLAGYCFGSWVAIEMARRLQQRSVPVAALLLIDPELPPGWRPARPTRRRKAAQTPPAELLNRMSLQRVTDALRSMAGRFGNRARVRLLQLAARGAPKRSALHRRLLRDTGDAIAVMALEYRPRPYEGAAVVLVPDDKPLTPEDRQAWQRFIPGGVRFQQLAGPTRDLLRHPYVRDVAACLLAHIEPASRNEPASRSETANHAT